MTKLMKTLSMMLAVIMLAGAVAGCGQSKTTTSEGTSAPVATSEESTEKVTTEEVTTEEVFVPDISKEVHLKIYTVSDPAPGHEDVLAEINKILKEKINTTIDVENLPWSTFWTKYPLLFASGEEFDAIYAANWMEYGKHASKNAFLELTDDLLQKYCPDVLRELPEDAWKQAKINGKIYMIPTTWNEFLINSYVIRGDLREKYGIGEIKTLDDFGSYLEAIKKNEPDMVPLDLAYGSNGALIGIFGYINEYTGVGGPFSCKFTDFSTNSIKLLWEDPEYRAFMKKMKEWKDRGYWTRDALSKKTDLNSSFANGKSASCINNENYSIGAFYNPWKTDHPDWKLEVWDATEGAKCLATAYIGSGYAIRATSKNPERALMLANIARTDEELNKLFVNGIKDVHYKDMGNNQMEIIATAPKPYNRDIDGMSYMFRNSKFQYLLANVYPTYYTVANAHAERGITSPWQAFNFDPVNVTTEITKINEVLNQYAPPLNLGYVEDVDKGIDELIAKLKEAGLEKVKEEVIRQADIFIKNYN